MFLTRLQATSILVVIKLVFGTVLGGKKCSLDQYLNKNAKCRYCKYCPPGEGMNFTAQVPIDEAGNPLRCHPCIPCPTGSYNDPEAKQYGCSQCRLNCWVMNRKEYEPCGGTKSGKCGACLNSSYVDYGNNNDSPCYERNGVEIKGIKFIENNDKVLLKNEDRSIDYVKTEENPPAWWIYVIIGGLGFVVAFVTVMVGLAVVRKYKFPRKCADLIPLESPTSVGQDNNGVGHKYEQVSLDEADLETDGFINGHMPHGEIETLQSAGPGRSNNVDNTDV